MEHFAHKISVTFENNITFFSNFDSGNLAKVEEVKRSAETPKEIGEIKNKINWKFHDVINP